MQCDVWSLVCGELGYAAFVLGCVLGCWLDGVCAYFFVFFVIGVWFV